LEPPSFTGWVGDWVMTSRLVSPVSMTPVAISPPPTARTTSPPARLERKLMPRRGFGSLGVMVLF
jgi:hypothetical protein